MTPPHASFTLHVRGAVDAIAPATAQADAWLVEHQASADARYLVSLAIEELVTNCIKYGYRDTAAHVIDIALSIVDRSLRMEVIDDGQPFNPLDAPAPDLSLPLEKRPIGGLGLHLLRALADDVRYERQDGTNRLLLTTRMRERSEGAYGVEGSHMNEATERVRKVWDEQADRWFARREAFLAATRPVHEWLVRNVAPASGQHLLEIAAGPGDTGFLAAPLLGNGRLVSTDIAPAMVEAARKRGAELGIGNVDYRVIDAQAMDFEDASFDGAICRWGFMLMPDPAAALREVHRVLKPTGHLAFAVFTGPAENPWVSIPVSVLREAGHLPRPSGDWQPGILALADRSRLEALVTGAGFRLTLELVSLAWTFANTDEYWTFLSELTALGPVFRALADASRDAVRAAIDARVAAYANAGGLALPAQCWCGLAIR
jgi:ubiquinone/menaquinone biosynthesis C-methylase UbiE/anti-sigma regulatory factor (Ser/Thr protein kinase)